MKEARMVEEVQNALVRMGVDDEVLAAGLFFPRGHMGGAFIGGMLGDEVGGSLGMAGGVLAGQHAADARSGLPERMLVGVSPTMIYGFDTVRDHERQPTEMVFRLQRPGLEVKVHQRVNVRVVELIDRESGAKVELEGQRIPGLGVSDVLHALEP